MSSSGDVPRADVPKKPLIETLLALASLFGLVITVIGMDVDRTFRTIAVILLVLAIVAGSTSVGSPRLRRPTFVSGVVLLVAAAGVLAFAPPGGGPEPVPEVTPTPVATALVMSSLEVLSPDAGRPGQLDVSLRNPTGNRVALNSAEVTLTGFTYVPVCSWGGSTEVTANYDLQLPDDPTSGTVLRKTLHQEIGPDEIDRFTLSFAPPSPRAQVPGGSPEDLASYLYRMKVVLRTDTGVTVDLGESVVETKNRISGDNVVTEPRPAETSDARLCGDDDACVRTAVSCLNRNRESLQQLLAGPIHASEGITNLKQQMQID